MKTKTVILIAAMAVLATSCNFVNKIKDLAMDIATTPTTAENVAERASILASNAVLVATVADTQYVLYRQNRDVFHKGHLYGCYSVRYVQTGEDGWSSSVIETKLEEPEQPLVVTRTADNAVTLTVDSIVIAITDIVVTDSVLTFNYGFDKPDRSATLYLFGKARKMKDPLCDTSIMQMLSLSLIMDDMMVDYEEAVDSTEVFVEDPETPELQDIEAGTSVTALTADERQAQYNRMDSLAMELGFKNRKVDATNDYIKFEASSVKKCYSSMEQMGKAAATSRCREWGVAHTPHHRDCKFTIEWM